MAILVRTLLGSAIVICLNVSVNLRATAGRILRVGISLGVCLCAGALALLIALVLLDTGSSLLIQGVSWPARCAPSILPVVI